MSDPSFMLDWFGGPTASIDLEPSGDQPDQHYRLKYSSPFRPTLRPPSEQIPTASSDLEYLRERLRAFGTGTTDMGVEELMDIGATLLEWVLPAAVATDLENPETFIEIGTDESLLHYPWELLHDGDEFLGLKHFVGRFVNQRRPLPARRAMFTQGSELGPLKVLVISVPNPVPRDQQRFDRLPAAEAEATAIVETLADAGVAADLLTGPAAKLEDVNRALRQPYHLIHYTGHAVFRADAPQESALVLHDRNWGIGALTAKLSRHPSIVCFINGCETTAGTEAAAAGKGYWDAQYNLFGLARAFLESGAYVLGTRWKLPDESGATFARAFYAALLGNGVPIGRAITEARRAVRDAAGPGDYSWASYVYYGDPRVCFKRLPEAADVTLPPPAPPGVDETGENPHLVRLDEWAKAYEELRATMPPGGPRTSAMSLVVREAADLGRAGDFSSVIDTFATGGEGARVVALALLQARPRAASIGFLIDAIEHPRSAFEQYHALMATKLLGQDVPEDHRARLVAVLDALGEHPDVVGTDRHLLAGQILAGLGVTG